MSDHWEGILAKLLSLSNLVRNESKRVLKKQIPKSDTIKNEVQANLLEYFNNFVKLVRFVYPSLNKEQEIYIKKLFTSLRDRVIRSYQVLKVPYKVPTSYLEYINLEIFDEEFEESEDKEESSESEAIPEQNIPKIKLENMAMSKTEFFNFASKIFPNEFDGSPSKLQSVIDSLNLLRVNCENHENNAVAYVKTRLVGKARDLIDDNDNLDTIINKLRTRIKTESSHMVTAKIFSLKQQHKDSTRYATEIEVLTETLKRAYINEGVPIAVAESYTTNTIVKALRTNSNSEKVKLIMEAGNFTNCEEAISKFITISGDTTPDSSTIFYTRNSQRYRAGNRHHRGHQSRGRGHYSENYTNNSDYRPTQRYLNANQQYHNHHGQYNRGRGNSRPNHRGQFPRYVRHYTQEESGNVQDPQPGPLGSL